VVISWVLVFLVGVHARTRTVGKVTGKATQVGRSTLLSKLCGLTAGSQEPQSGVCVVRATHVPPSVLCPPLLIDPPPSQEKIIIIPRPRMWYKGGRGWMDGSISLADTNAWRIDGFGCDGVLQLLGGI